MSAEETHVVIRDAAGVSTAFRLAEGSLVRKDPFTGQTQVVTAGDASRRQDTRTPQGIWSDQSGGGGEWAYDEVQELTTFTDSDCDTRSGMLVLPPNPAAMNGTYALNPTQIVSGLYLGQASAEVLFFMRNVSAAGSTLYVYDPTANAGAGGIVAKQAGGTNVGGISQACAYDGKWHVVSSQGSGAGGHTIVSSANGAVWTDKAVGGVDQAVGCCVHDNKFWTYDKVNAKLTWATDPTSATWTYQSATLKLQVDEAVQGLEEWHDPRGKPVVMILTNLRLLWYDEDEDAYKLLDEWPEFGTPGTTAWPHVWKRDLNLYVGLYATGQLDTVLWYSGTANLASPSLRGGLPEAARPQIADLHGTRYWLYVVGIHNGSHYGRLYAMDDAQHFHHIHWGTATARTNGGFKGPGRFYLVAYDGTANIQLYKLVVPDNALNPLVASGRTYHGNSTTHWHEFAWFDGGTENMPLTALWVTVQARDMSNGGASGTPANTRIYLEYKLQGDANWTGLVGGVGYLTNTDTYPNVVRFAPAGVYGVKFRQIKLRVGLWSSSTTVSPVVPSVALAYLRDEKPRYGYTLELDFSDLDHPLYRGKDRAQLEAILEAYAQPGALVDFYLARGDETPAPPTGKTVPNCRAEFSAVYHPTLGIVAARVLLKDFAAPASGV